MTITFENEMFYWRGPAPFHFVAIPEQPSRDIKSIAAQITYGWGVIPVRVRVGNTTWTTSLFPKDGLYLVPIKKMVQTAETIGVGDRVVVSVDLG